MNTNSRSNSRKWKYLFIGILILLVCFSLCFFCCRSTYVGTYLWYGMLAQIGNSEYERINAQSLENLPVYPGSELIYTETRGGVYFDIFSWTFLTPFVVAYYGTAQDASAQEIDNFYVTALEQAGWWQRDSHSMKNGTHCFSVLVSVRNIEGNHNSIIVSDIPDPYDEVLEQYEAVYAVFIRPTAESVWIIDELPEWISQTCEPE